MVSHDRLRPDGAKNIGKKSALRMLAVLLLIKSNINLHKKVSAVISLNISLQLNQVFLKKIFYFYLLFIL